MPGSGTLGEGAAMLIVISWCNVVTDADISTNPM
jgi:hypothetical protein